MKKSPVGLLGGSWASALTGIAILSLGVAGAGCANEEQGDTVTETSSALTATLSGTISDTQGRPLQGVTVALNGRTQATQTTGATGTYSFALNIPQASASWSIMPTRSGCSFNPSVVNLNGITSSRVNNFTGSGTSCVGVAQAPTLSATDPGPRAGAAAAGGPLAGLSAQELAFFTAAQTGPFEEIDSVSGNVPGETGSGLGPGYNLNSCAGCHAQPAIGGASPGLSSPQHPTPNPQVALATLDGAIRSANRANVSVYVVDPRESPARDPNAPDRPLRHRSQRGNPAAPRPDRPPSAPRHRAG